MQLLSEIDNLNQMLIKMSEVVSSNIERSILAYENESICEINDDIVDQYERLIEEICLDILVKERPYAKDLRIVSGILKLVSDLERIGDHAEDIMEFNKRLRKTEMPRYKKIDDMVNETLYMVKESIKSYLTLDINKAKEIINHDDIIDEIYDDVINRLIEEPQNGNNEFVIYTTLIVKYMERIADHAVNIAEWVIYIDNGFHKDRKIY